MNVKQTQLLLEYIAIEENDGLYSPKGIDGVMGPNTQKAIDHVKATFGCDENGLPGIIGKTVPKIPTDDKKSGDFWDEIEFFTKEEFACHCGKCGGFPKDPVEKLVRIANKIRREAGAPAYVSSGVRCPEHNAAVGGVYNSRHLNGWAMDFCIRGWNSAKLDALVGAQQGVAYHYMIDNEFVHMDVVL